MKKDRLWRNVWPRLSNIGLGGRLLNSEGTAKSFVKPRSKCLSSFVKEWSPDHAIRLIACPKVSAATNSPNLGKTETVSGRTCARLRLRMGGQRDPAGRSTGVALGKYSARPLRRVSRDLLQPPATFKCVVFLPRALYCLAPHRRALHVCEGPHWVLGAGAFRFLP